MYVSYSNTRTKLFKAIQLETYKRPDVQNG